MSKYKNIETTIDGIRFDSKKEAARYAELKLLEQAGIITDLKCQHRFPLTVNGSNVGSYIADFTYTEKGKLIVEDVKSLVTRRLPVYRLKRRLMDALFGITITEV